MNDAEMQRPTPPVSPVFSPSMSGRQPESTTAARARACHVMMEGACEILGANGQSRYMLDSRLDDQQALAAPRTILLGLADTYGPAGARGLALRIGRATFRYGLREIGEQAGFREVGFRILPSPRRVESGLHMLACLFSELTGSPVQVTDHENAWILRFPFRLPDGEEGQMIRWLITGLLQEFSSWAGGGRFYNITASGCDASSTQPCAFQVDKKPLD
jgi:hypothetical protein